MTNETNQALERLFLDNRIVFWNDEKQEMQEDFDDFNHEKVEKLVIDNNEYSIKYLVLKEKPKNKFLIYRKGKRPKDIDNWLLDLELAYAEFKTDKVSQWAVELGLVEQRKIVEQYKEFFSLKKNREGLKKFLDPNQDYKEGILERKMLAVCIGAKQPRIDSVLETMLNDLAENKDDVEKAITRFKLNDFLWKQAEEYYHYKSSTPSIEDFAIAVFKACFDYETGEKITLKESVVGFLNRWKNNRLNEKAFEELSYKYDDILRITQKLENLDFKKLIEVDYFEAIDKKILSTLVKQVEAQTISKEECATIISQRRMTYWFEKYKDAYDAIKVASQFINYVENSNLIPQSLNDGISKYTKEWYKIDQLYRKFVYSCRLFEKVDLLRSLQDKVEKLYSNKYLLILGDNWQKQIDGLNKWSGFDVPLQRNFFNRYVKPKISADKKIYVIISDALRYEIGQEMVSRIMQEDRYEAEIDAMVSQVPSYTQLGMASLLPNETISLADNESGNILVDGSPTMGTANRNKILNKQPKKGSATTAKDFMDLDRDQSRELLKNNEFLYIYHNHIDAVGDKKDSEERVFDAVEKTVIELIDIVKKLANANASNIIITADHGFLFQYKPLDESDYLGDEATGSQMSYQDRRFVFGKGLNKSKGFKAFSAKDLGLENDDIDVLFPKSINRLRRQGSGSRFVHGGTSLQEIIVPVIKINKKRKSDVIKVDVEVLQGAKASNTITSGQHTVVLYQNEATSEKIQPRNLRAGIWVGDELISDTHELIFDNSAESPRDRETRVRFILTKKAEEFNNQEVSLRLDEKVQGTTHYQEYKSVKFLIRRSFTTDFDF